MGISKELREAGTLLNRLRQERGLGKAALIPARVKVTRAMMREIALTVWKKYPQAWTQWDYELGELTLFLVEQEILTIINDVKRGVKMTKNGFDIPWDLKT